MPLNAFDVLVRVDDRKQIAAILAEHQADALAIAARANARLLESFLRRSVPIETPLPTSSLAATIHVRHPSFPYAALHTSIEAYMFIEYPGARLCVLDWLCALLRPIVAREYTVDVSREEVWPVTLLLPLFARFRITSELRESIDALTGTDEQMADIDYTPPLSTIDAFWRALDADFGKWAKTVPVDGS
jgi:hypothetical protein